MGSCRRKRPRHLEALAKTIAGSFSTVGPNQNTSLDEGRGNQKTRDGRQLPTTLLIRAHSRR
eukprot:9679822-Lingulodinium_polyedra.AAC.1